jgi:hypothetical protein
MTVTTVARYSVGDTEVAMAESKRAKAMWRKAGAKDFRGVQMFTGPFHGEWIFYIDFDDLAHLQKCRDAVLNTEYFKTIAANNAKAGNKQTARDIMIGLDLA